MDIHTELPIGYTIICFLLSLVVVVFLYRKAQRFKDLSFFQRIIPAALRALVVFVLAFFLLGPTLKYIDLKLENPILLVANDVSTSMSQDSLSQKNWNAAFRDQFQDENLELKFVNFGSQVIDEGKEKGSINQKTSFSNLSSFIANNYEGLNLAGIVIASDGISNSGLNPMYSSMLPLAPIYTIGFGDTTQLQDARIMNLQYNELGKLNAVAPINFDVKTVGLQGKKVKAVLYNQGKKIKEKSISIAANSSFDKIQWEIELNEVGIEKYRLEIQTDFIEANVENNSEVFFVDVQEVRKKIVLLAAVPHPDVAAIASAISDQFGIEVEIKLAADGKPSLEGVQLAILHQLPQKGKSYPWLKDIISSDIGLWFIAGEQSNLNELGKLQNWLGINTSKGNPDAVFPVLNPEFKAFTLDSEIAQSFQVNKPMLKPFANYNAPANADVLLYQRIGNLLTPYPLLFAVNDGNRKMGFLLAEGIWMQKLVEQQKNGDTKSFDAILKKWVNYLSIQEQKERLRVDADRRYAINDGVSMSARYYNASFELDNAVNLVADLKNEAGEKFSYNFRPLNDAFLLQTKGLPAGSYTYRVAVEGQSAIWKEGGFIIESSNIEVQDLQANHQLLKQIASKSQGAFFYPNQVNELVENIGQSKSTKVLQYEELVFKNILDFYWLFYVLLGLLCAEWAWRKWLGMI